MVITGLFCYLIISYLLQPFLFWGKSKEWWHAGRNNQEMINRPEFKIPDAGLKAAKVTAATAAPSKVFEPSIPDYNERVFTQRAIDVERDFQEEIGALFAASINCKFTLLIRDSMLIGLTVNSSAP
jgi:hypothetical protein